MSAGLSEFESAFEVNDDVVLLQSLWRTEFHAPELLPYQEELVESIKQLLYDQQNLIDDKIDAGEEREFFTITIYQMDIDRVRYSLAKYLRVRLQKIEEQLDAIVSSADYMDRLSVAERVYLTKLNALHNTVFEDSILKRLPETNAQYFRTIDDRYQHAQPNLEKFVFCQIQDEINRMYISEDRYQNYSQGDIAVLRYKIVRDYILEGKIQLI